MQNSGYHGDKKKENFQSCKPQGFITWHVTLFNGAQQRLFNLSLYGALLQGSQCFCFPPFLTAKGIKLHLSVICMSIDFNVLEPSKQIINPFNLYLFSSPGYMPWLSIIIDTLSSTFYLNHFFCLISKPNVIKLDRKVPCIKLDQSCSKNQILHLFVLLK